MNGLKITKTAILPNFGLAKITSEKNPVFRLFTVCRGENQDVDNSSTESVHRVLKAHGVRYTIARIQNKRVFILEDTLTNRPVVSAIVNQYGTQAVTFK